MCACENSKLLKALMNSVGYATETDDGSENTKYTTIHNGGVEDGEMRGEERMRAKWGQECSYSLSSFLCQMRNRMKLVENHLIITFHLSFCYFFEIIIFHQSGTECSLWQVGRLAS